MFSETDINERVYWLIYQLHMDYDAIMTSPWEVVDWLYNRHVQELVDIQKQKEQQNNHFI